jgi:hypothetical protein
VVSTILFLSTQLEEKEEKDEQTFYVHVLFNGDIKDVEMMQTAIH